MQPLFDRILTVNLILSTLTFYIAARIYVLPRVHELRPQVILLPILLLHSLRQLGLMFLTRGATYPGMPPEFAYPAAIGDFVTSYSLLWRYQPWRKTFPSDNPSFGFSILWVRST